MTQRTCPLCGGRYTCFGDSYSDGEERIERPFSSQQCVNRECGLPCSLWNQIEMLQSEIKRLKSANLTPEEFNELCHDLHDKGCPITRDQHKHNCDEFREKLFGPVVMQPMIHEPILNGDNIVDGSH